MGCFDTVCFEKPNRFLKRFGKIISFDFESYEMDFQTKSLNANFDNYSITDNDKFVSNRVVTRNFSGSFECYNMNKNYWICFLVTINKGKVTNIKLVDFIIDHDIRFKFPKYKENLLMLNTLKPKNEKSRNRI